MKQKKMLTLTFSQLKQIYGQEIPEIVEIADKSSTCLLYTSRCV